MATYWRGLEPLYERCDGVIRFKKLRLEGQLLTDDDMVGKTFRLVVKDRETDPDTGGHEYDGSVQPGPVVLFEIPAAHLPAGVGDRWGYAYLTDSSGRHALGYGPIPVVRL